MRADHVCASVTLLLLASIADLAAQTVCDADGRHPAPQAGVGLLQCVGGGCGIFGGTSAAPEHRFTVEPRLWHIARPGPAAGLLEEGDQLVAVDGAPITTRVAGRRLARLVAATPLELTVRRAGALRTVRIVPETGCGYPMLVVTDGNALPPELATAPAAQAPAVAPFELGLTLGCDGCRWTRVYDGAVAWQTIEVPRVLAIDAGGPAARSGLAVGDLLLTVDGRAIMSEAGGRYLGTIRPGQRVEIGYSHAGESHTTQLTTGVPPTSR
jgi:membrane-associated protease RseP (regulator of RpoE activity)